MFDSSSFLATVTAILHMRDGGIQEVRCSAGDYEKIHGILVTAFKDDNGMWRVFVREDADGNPTDYEKADGHLTDGVGFFHYLDRMKKEHWSKYHFKNNDWTDMTRANWETCRGKNQGSRAEKRIRKVLKRAA